MNNYLPPVKDYNHADKMARGFHFTIDEWGRWIVHDETMGIGVVERQAVAALFSGAGQGKYAGKGLCVDEAGRYWLKAPPDDVYGVEVEDTPFIITRIEFYGHKLKVFTQFEEAVEVTDKADFFKYPQGARPEIPAVMVRNGLMARLSRVVYYELAEKGWL